jgi:hypothetical protein
MMFHICLHFAMSGPNQFAPRFHPIGGQLPHGSLGAGPITASSVPDPAFQSSSASRFTAGCFGFLLFTQCRDRPERYDAFEPEPAGVAHSLSVSVSYKGALLFPSKE